MFLQVFLLQVLLLNLLLVRALLFSQIVYTKSPKLIHHKYSLKHLDLLQFYLPVPYKLLGSPHKGMPLFQSTYSARLVNIPFVGSSRRLLMSEPRMVLLL